MGPSMLESFPSAAAEGLLRHGGKQEQEPEEDRNIRPFGFATRPLLDRLFLTIGGHWEDTGLATFPHLAYIY